MPLITRRKPLKLRIMEFYDLAYYVNQQRTLTATADGGVSPYSYSWDFGDNSSTTGNPVTHTYVSAGTFTITCTVTDSIGNKASGTTTITIVTPLATTLSLSGPSYAAEGSSQTVTAKLTDSSGVALSGKSVTIRAGPDSTFPSGGTTTTLTTDLNGQVSLNLTMPNAVELYDVTATFNGTSEYIGSSSNLVQISIYKPLTVSIGKS